MSQVVGSLSPIDMQVSRFSHYVLRTHLFRSLYAKNDVLKEATLYFIVSDKLVLLRRTYLPVVRSNYCFEAKTLHRLLPPGLMLNSHCILDTHDAFFARKDIFFSWV